MKRAIRFGLLPLMIVIAGWSADAPLVPLKPATAQYSGGGSRDDENRDERRERWRRENGDRGRDWRDRGRDEERRGDDRSGNSSSSSSGATSGTSSSSGDTKPAASSAPSASTVDYAKSLVKERDKNSNGFLDGDEKKELRGRAAEADANGDGAITTEELVAKLSSPGGPTSPSAGSATSSTPSSSNSSAGASSSTRPDEKAKSSVDTAKRVFTGSAGGAAASTKEGDPRKSFRFSTMKDRLPKNLPSFFSRDANGDGQVSMNEYSRSWSKSTVTEFQQHDANGDGIITAKEVSKPAATGG